MTKLPHIVILGAGFAGLGAAVRLKKANALVTLVDKNDYHTFQPLLYQVATSILEPETVGESLAKIIDDQDNLTILKAHVTAVDLQNRKVQLAEYDALSYDYLVLALGAQVNFFGIEGAVENAFPLYSLVDAINLRDHILQQFKIVEEDPSSADSGALNFVILGGGPTGVEVSGSLATFLFEEIGSRFPKVPIEKVKIILIEGRDHLFTMFKEDLQLYTKYSLQELGVRLHLGQRITRVAPDFVELQSGERINTNTLVWAAGLQANKLVHYLGLELGPGGRIPATSALNLEQYPEVFVGGDIAIINDHKSNEPLPQLGSVAMQSGQQIGDNIKRIIKGKSAKKFKYLDKGTMATISPGHAVIQLPRGRSMTGNKAFFAWGTVHLALLPDRTSRRSALKQWSQTMYSHDRLDHIDLENEAEL